MQTKLRDFREHDLGKEKMFSSSHEIYFIQHSEREIWRLFKSGSEVALTNIYKYFYTPLYRYGSQFTRDRDIIQDAIQDLFSELLKRRDKLSDTSSIKFYLFKSLKTTILRLLRLRKKYPSLDSTDQGLEFGMSLSQEDKIISGQIEIEKKEKLNAALNQLGKKQREIIYYYYFEGLTISEIAALMNFKNDKSVQNLLYKSINNIKFKLLIISTLILFTKLFQ